MMVKLGFEHEWNQMNEAAEKEVEEEARIGDYEDGDGFFKQRKLHEGLLEEVKGTMEFFQEGLLKAPAEKAEIEMTLDYLQGRGKILRSASPRLSWRNRRNRAPEEAGEDNDDWVFV
jgi:hypothetical protein